MNIVTKEGLSHFWDKLKDKFADKSTTYSKTETRNYIASRGENLVTNGTSLLGNNYNFSAFTYDGSDTYYAGGSFKYTVSGGAPVIDEYIPIDATDSYVLSYFLKTDNNTIRFYDFINCYDIDKNTIMAYNVMWISGSTTTLARELKNGDTKVYLTSVAGFNKTITNNYQRGLTFWNYKNSYGYQYPTETYSRNTYSDLWADSNSFNATENSITLKSAWNKGTFPVGTSVSQRSDGGNYMYLNSNYLGTLEWEKHVGVINGVGKNNESGKFREGTAFVKIGWLMNRYAIANTLVSTVLFTKSRALSIKKDGEAASATKLGTTNVGNSAHPIYIKAGVPTVSTDYSVPNDNASARSVLLRPTDADNAGASHHSYSSKITYVASTDTLTVANLNGKAKSAISADSVAWANITNKPTLFSGSYNDLTNKPTIPSAVTEATISGWGFTKNTGTYNKPSGGIPKSDLSSAVQTSLEKADTALQSYIEQYQGTVKKVNNISPDTNGNVTLSASNVNASPSNHTHSQYVQNETLDDYYDAQTVDDLIFSVTGQTPEQWDFVIDSYVADDGGTWYRKYKSGWIEQGGVIQRGSSLSKGTNWAYNVNFPVPFANTNYSVTLTASYGTATSTSAGHEDSVNTKTVAGFSGSHYNRNGSDAQPNTIGVEWSAKGYRDESIQTSFTLNVSKYSANPVQTITTKVKVGSTTTTYSGNQTNITVPLGATVTVNTSRDNYITYEGAEWVIPSKSTRHPYPTGSIIYNNEDKNASTFTFVMVEDVTITTTEPNIQEYYDYDPGGGD